MKMITLALLPVLMLTVGCAQKKFTATPASKSAPAAVQKDDSGDQTTTTVSAPPDEQAVQVGINFEDDGSAKSDHDFNDAVLCFNGKFNLFYVDGDKSSMNIQKIESSADQSITVKATNLAGCGHDLVVTITHADGTTSPTNITTAQIGKGETAQETKFDLVKGDTLNVVMTTTEIPGNAICVASNTHTMTEKDWSHVSSTCNTSNSDQGVSGMKY